MTPLIGCVLTDLDDDPVGGLKFLEVLARILAEAALVARPTNLGLYAGSSMSWPDRSPEKGLH